jgi:hypothetical protein
MRCENGFDQHSALYGRDTVSTQYPNGIVIATSAANANMRFSSLTPRVYAITTIMIGALIKYSIHRVGDLHCSSSDK